jgi:hypothetical protein
MAADDRKRRAHSNVFLPGIDRMIDAARARLNLCHPRQVPASSELLSACRDNWRDLATNIADVFVITE